MKLPLFIASRYLFAKKSHNVINIVSAISSVGMAVGTAALIVILSVYNGFDGLIKSMLSSVEPDLLITPSHGKYFVPDGPAYEWAKECDGIKSMCTVLQDNVFVSYDSQQGTALVKGVDSIYQQESTLADYVTDGEFYLMKGERPYAAVGRALASAMDINVNFISPICLYYPQRDGRISVLNPLSSLGEQRVWPSCEFNINTQVDSRLIITDRSVMTALLGLEDEVSAVEIRLADGHSARKARSIRKELESMLGPDYVVLDRAQQNPSLYKMLVYEKAAVYLIMLFIVLILGFSIFGSLSMLIIDKKDDIRILHSMGMDSAQIRGIFTLEGWMISLCGLAAGLALGIVLCLAQQYGGFVKMPANFMVSSYPVMLHWSDVVLSAAVIALIGYLIALVPARRIVTEE